MSEFTVILEQLRQGDASAGDRLLPLVYHELRRIAASKMSHESAALTLQPTALVHEAWLRLGGPEQTAWQNRRHFLGAAAEAMRRILIDRARSRHRVRHGGGLVRVDWEESLSRPDDTPSDQIVALSESLDRLAAAHPDMAELVKLRYFSGLTLEEAASTLDISHAMAKRWWTFARAWLVRDLERTGGTPSA